MKFFIYLNRRVLVMTLLSAKFAKENAKVYFYYSLGKCSRSQTHVIFLFLFQNFDLTFHANWIHRRQFAQYVKFFYTGKKKKQEKLLSDVVS